MLHSHPSICPLLVLVFAFLIFTVFNPRIAQASNISLVLQQAAVVAASAVGQTLIILTAGIDLSIGAATILSMLIMANLAANTMPNDRAASNSHTEVTSRTASADSTRGNGSCPGWGDSAANQELPGQWQTQGLRRLSRSPGRCVAAEDHLDRDGPFPLGRLSNCPASSRYPSSAAPA